MSLTDDHRWRQFLASPQRRAWLVLAIGLLLLPVTMVLVRAAIRSNLNDVSDWLPAHYIETSQYRWFKERFGREDFVVVSWPGCTLDDPRMDIVARRLRERSTQAAAQGGAELFIRVTTGRDLIDELTSDRIGLSEQQAVHRLQGTVVGPDGRQTCVVVALDDTHGPRLREVLHEIRAAAVDSGLESGEVHLGGPPVVNDAINQSSSQSLLRLAGLAAAVGLVIAWLCFREVRLTLIVFTVAGYAAALSLAVLPLVGVPLNAILITMVPLVYVAAMSGAIHLSNYYLESLRRDGPERAVESAVRHAVLPLVLAAVTTAIGLLSLWYSDLAPIRLFGIFSAVGVMIGLGMQIVFLPAFIRCWPQRAPLSSAAPYGVAASGSPSTSHSASAAGVMEGAEELSPFWQRVAEHVPRYSWAYTAAFAFLLGMGLIGLSRVETSIQIMRLFSPATPIIASYAWLEEHLGAMVPMEVVIRFDSSNSQRTFQRLELIKHLQTLIGEIPGVSGSLSAATFTPPIRPGGRSVWSVVTDVRLKHARQNLIDTGYLYADGDEEAWRISVRATEGEQIDGEQFERRLREQIEPVLAQERSAGIHGLEVMYTGAVPIIYKARRSLLDGLTLGFATDVVLVVIAVIAMVRNWSSGVLLLLTSVFPMAVIFGLMGWCQWPVDIGSMMTPSVALGVTIDDAIHFVLWYRRGIAEGLSQRKAVELAYAGCGRAMIQSWGVIGVGLSVFALSSFVPTFRFGTLIIALLSAALICNLIFLPALLAGPLGRWLARGVQPTTER
ncbi:MAG: MMPL family transporter [Pirellulales bacterium]